MSTQLAIANIALNTASVSRQGFGTILFAGKHNYFAERVRSYTSTLSMVADGIPTDSNVYRAAQSAFSQIPSPAMIKIGRQESTSVLAPVNLGNGSEYKITLNALDSTAAEYAFTADGSSSAETVVDALIAAIDADTDITSKVTVSKVGSTTGAKLHIVQTVSGTDWFTVSLLTNLDESFVAVSTETAAQTIAAISDEDDDYYYFTAEDKSNTFITAAAADIEAKMKFYRTSISEVGSYASTPTGSGADLQTSNYFRSSCFYHQDATTSFPEVAALAEIAQEVTGSVVYANRLVAAVSPSQNAAGKDLTSTQQTNLRKANIDFLSRVGKAASDPVIAVIGKSASGEWIDNIVGIDNMKIDLQADTTNLFIRQKSSKVAFNNKGVNQLRSVWGTVLGLYTERGGHNFIEDDFEIFMPDQNDFNPADKSTREFKQATFKATLTNGIHTTVISGTLSL